MDKKKKIIAIVGPTGIGKSNLSIQLAKAFDGQVISCDSMQVYREMDIGTAKITEKEKQGIKHYLLNEQSYDQEYNVMIFQDRCRKAIQNIQQANHLPILCGGTGLYLKAALYDYVFETEEVDEAYKEELQQKTNEELVDLLKQIDPKALEKIHPNNRKRIIRALVIAHSGTIKSEREAQQEHKPLYDVLFIGLDMDRKKLHEQIDLRVDKMFEEGLEKEVVSLFSDPKTWEYTSFQGIGYKEFKEYFLQDRTIEEVKELIKIHSRQYAKRQYTWFKNQMPVQWFDVNDKEKIMNFVKEFLQ